MRSVIEWLGQSRGDAPVDYGLAPRSPDKARRGPATRAGATLAFGHPAAWAGGALQWCSFAC